jgi:hypothetical protein
MPPPVQEESPLTTECCRCKTKQTLTVHMATVNPPYSTTGEAQTVECIERKRNFYPFLPGPITAGLFRA